MRFLATKNKETISHNHGLKLSLTSGDIIDSWYTEGDQTVIEKTEGIITYRQAAEGLFGFMQLPIPIIDGEHSKAVSFKLYTTLFNFLNKHLSYKLIRIWNYIPSIIKELDDPKFDSEIYRCFNHGRYTAFKNEYGENRLDWKIPAASAVGCNDKMLKIEFFASNVSPIYIENKIQKPAINYSEKFGIIPPVFSRGVIYKNNNQTFLISAGTASIVNEETLHHGNLYAQLMQSIQNLRILTSQFNLKPYNIHYSFGLEDLVLLRTYYRDEKDRQFLEKMLSKIVVPSCQLSFQKADICRKDLLVELEGIFLKKGEYANTSQEKYQIKSNRIQVETLEIHIAEHCNLKCFHCCTNSPYNKKRLLTLREVEKACNQLAKYFQADVFKLLGGEPLLHPQLIQIIDIAKASGVSENIRIVTNGLLLHRMPDEFWDKIDQLTISNYLSAPISEENIEIFWKKARKYEVVLNIKYVDEFNEILLKKPNTDKQKNQMIYDDCWIRHRCLMIRNGVFFKCARAAYMDIYKKKLNLPKLTHEPNSYAIKDGIPINDPDFLDIAQKYLNNKKPLASCRYCLGVSGKLIPNQQMR